MDVICINAKFDSEQLAFYDKFGVAIPEQEKMYTTRDVIRNSTGETGILLEEIVNPKVPFHHPMGGIKEMEPNWNIERFRTLQGTPLVAMELILEHSKSRTRINH